jgi:hypothetical protein
MVRLLVAAALLLGLSFSGCSCEEELGHIPDPGAITGRVCDPGEHSGIYNARVYVVVNRGGKVEEVDAFTDAEGHFDLEGVPPGTYDLQVARGSFTTTVEDVVVAEAETTALDEADCLAPDVVNMTVYTGHDSVEEVLARLGYTDFEIVDTLSGSSEHDDTTPSWFTAAFGDAAAFADQDILFVNCGAHEWALDNADPQDVQRALDNLRDFVEAGGNIYFSDWAYDLVEALYPDAVDWVGDDLVRDDAQRGKQQDFVADVVDAEMAAILGRARATLRFNQGRIALAERLGPIARPLLNADITADDGNGGTETLSQVPVLLEILPAGESGGRILFTSFHNGASNTPDMDDILRAIVFAL